MKIELDTTKAKLVVIIDGVRSEISEEDTERLIDEYSDFRSFPADVRNRDYQHGRHFMTGCIDAVVRALGLDAEILHQWGTEAMKELRETLENKS